MIGGRNTTTAEIAKDNYEKIKRISLEEKKPVREVLDKLLREVLEKREENK